MKWFILAVVLSIVPAIWLFIKIKKSNYDDGLPDIKDVCDCNECKRDRDEINEPYP